jgi:hypothetical protein
MKLIGFIVILAGLLILIVGYTMWEEPEFSWNGVLNVLYGAVSMISNIGYQLLSCIYSAIIRITSEPSSLLALAIMAIGIGIIAVGVKAISS